eukprot:7379328-Prymnesium_polylepis.4
MQRAHHNELANARTCEQHGNSLPALAGDVVVETVCAEWRGHTSNVVIDERHRCIAASAVDQQPSKGQPRVNCAVARGEAQHTR